VPSGGGPEAGNSGRQAQAGCTELIIQSIDTVIELATSCSADPPIRAIRAATDRLMIFSWVIRSGRSVRWHAPVGREMSVQCEWFTHSERMRHAGFQAITPLR